jgi:predicted metal-binding protein
MSKKIKVAPATVLSVPTGWDETLLICGKCSKKLSGGFGKDGAEPLKTVLRAYLRKHGRRSTRIIEVKCFGVCPRKAVTMARSSKPGSLLVVGARVDPASLLSWLPLRNSE